MYDIIILPPAEKEIEKLPNDVADAILEAIDKLAHTPRPSGAKQMNNYSTPRLQVRIYHRIKVKRVYRIIYHIEDQKCIVTIIKTGHRSKIYKSK